MSSPSLRCLQTVTPLAGQLGLDIEQVDQLAPGEMATVRWLRSVACRGPLLVCTHGEVVGPILTALRDEDDVELGPDPTWEKGSVWVLIRDKERFKSAAHLPPPSLE